MKTKADPYRDVSFSMQFDLPMTLTGLGIRSSVFRANRSFFAQKGANERFAQKNERFTHLLIFSERPERFAHKCSFPLRDVSESLMVAHFW